VIGLDTNVLVRYIAQDDPEQAAYATRSIESLTEDDPGYVSLVTLVEVYWVLRRSYGLVRRDAGRVIARLLDARELSLAEPQVVRRAMAGMKDDVDFPDALIGELGRAVGCSHTVTFDKRAARLPDVRLLSTS
jgi:predicted nucleic-acid-binding protein